MRRTVVEIRLSKHSTIVCTSGHGDLLAHEVRPARDKVSIEHEMLFVGRAEPLSRSAPRLPLAPAAEPR